MLLVLLDHLSTSVVGDTLIKPCHLLEIAVNLPYPSCALAARRKWEGRLQLGVSMFHWFVFADLWMKQSHHWEEKAWLVVSSFELTLYWHSPLCFWNPTNWQLPLYLSLKLSVKFAFQVGISLEISPRKFFGSSWLSFPTQPLKNGKRELCSFPTWWQSFQMVSTKSFIIFL